MRVALDLRGLHQALLHSPTGGLGGPGMYSLELARHLVQAPQAAEMDWEFVVFPGRLPATIAELAGTSPAGTGARSRVRVMPLGIQLVSRRLSRSRYGRLMKLVDGATLSRLCHAARLDVFHSLDGAAVPWAAGATRSICTAHDLYDLLPEKSPAVRHVGRTGYLNQVQSAKCKVQNEAACGSHLGFCLDRFLLTWPLRRASHIVAVSQDTARDVHTLLGVTQERIRVIYPGVFEALLERGARALDTSDGASVSVAGPFFLHTGVLRPRKNPDNILAGVARVVRDQLPDHSLICVGPYQTATGLGAALVKKWRAAGGPVDRLILLGDVTDQELVTLYARAAGLVFPSLHEGFGQTVAEALAVGTPAVTSRAGATPESGGDLAIYVDPLDPAAIATGCLQVVRDAALRERVRREGPRWIAERFTWPLASQQVFELYAACASS